MTGDVISGVGSLGNTETHKEKGHMKMKAGTGVIYKPWNAKDCQKLLEDRKPKQNRISL